MKIILTVIRWAVSVGAALVAAMLLLASPHSHLLFGAAAALFVFAIIINPLAKRRLVFLNKKWIAAISATLSFVACVVFITCAVPINNRDANEGQEDAEHHKDRNTNPYAADLAKINADAAEKFKQSLINSCGLTDKEYQSVVKFGQSSIDLNNRDSIKGLLIAIDGNGKVPDDEVLNIFIQDAKGNRKMARAVKKFQNMTEQDKEIAQTNSICNGKETEENVNKILKHI